MNRSELKRYVAFSLFASVCYFSTSLIESWDEVYLGAQRWAEPNDATWTFIAMVVGNTLLVVAQVGLGYMIFSRKSWPIWAWIIYCAFVALSGWIGLVLVTVYTVLCFIDKKYELNET